MKQGTLSVIFIVVLLLLAGTAMAHRSGGMMLGLDAEGISERYPADSEEVSAITDKYRDDLDALQVKLDAKHAEILQARDNDATTLGQLRKLRTEMSKVRIARRELVAKIDIELAEKFGPGTNMGAMNGGMNMGAMNGGMNMGAMNGGMHKGMMNGGMHKGMMGGGMHKGMMGGGMKMGMMNGGMHKGMMGGGMHKGMMGGGMNMDMTNDGMNMDMMDHDQQGAKEDEDLFR